MTNVYISTADAKQNFSQVINEVFYAAKRFVVMSHGKPKAIITPVDNTQPHTTALSQPNKSAIHSLKALHTRFNKGELTTADLEIPRSERDSDISDLC